MPRCFDTARRSHTASPDPSCRVNVAMTPARVLTERRARASTRRRVRRRAARPPPDVCTVRTFRPCISAHAVHASVSSVFTRARPAVDALQRAMYVLERGKLVEKKVTEILPDARRARELGDAARRRWTCDASGGRFWTALARWTQTTTTVEITVALPKGTRARDLRITLNTTSMTLWSTWSGTVDACSGALARRCKVDESAWSCDGDELMIMLVKDDGGRDGVPWQVRDVPCISRSRRLTDDVHRAFYGVVRVPNPSRTSCGT